MTKEEELVRLLEEDPTKAGDCWWTSNRWNRTGFRSWLTPTKGDRSAAVARQYCRRSGKTDNWQIGVVIALCLDGRALLTGARLDLPEKWIIHSKRCEKTGIPTADRAFATKNKLAWLLIQEAKANGLKLDWACADASYGRNLDLLLKMTSMGKTFVMDVKTTQMVWQEKPQGTKRPSAVAKSGACEVG